MVILKETSSITDKTDIFTPGVYPAVLGKYISDRLFEGKVKKAFHDYLGSNTRVYIASTLKTRKFLAGKIDVALIKDVLNWCAESSYGFKPAHQVMFQIGLIKSLPSFSTPPKSNLAAVKKIIKDSKAASIVARWYDEEGAKPSEVSLEDIKDMLDAATDYQEIKIVKAALKEGLTRGTGKRINEEAKRITIVCPVSGRDPLSIRFTLKGDRFISSELVGEEVDDCLDFLKAKKIKATEMDSNYYRGHGQSYRVVFPKKDAVKLSLTREAGMRIIKEATDIPYYANHLRKQFQGLSFVVEGLDKDMIIHMLAAFQYYFDKEEDPDEAMKILSKKWTSGEWGYTSSKGKIPRAKEAEALPKVVKWYNDFLEDRA